MAETVQCETLERLPQYDAYALPVASIYYDETFNCRGSFLLQSVKDLADSIQATILEIPVIVQPWDKDGYSFRLLAGHRRFVAVTKFLKRETIPASIRYNLTEYQARILNFTENLARKDLNPLEEAQALKHLYPEGVSLRVAAAELKRPTGWVSDRLRLLTLPEEIQQFAAAGLIAMCSIKVLVALPPEEQLVAARKIVENKQRYGKAASMKHLDKRYRRKFGYRKSKEEINRMVAKMLGWGVTGLGPRMGAWCAGYITDAEFVRDIRESLKKQPDELI